MYRVCAEEKILIHLLCRMVYTGRPYRGSEAEFMGRLSKMVEKKIPPHGAYTDAEDQKILQSKNLVATSKALGRTYSAISQRKSKLMGGANDKSGKNKVAEPVQGY